jgi:hypothetical protein
MTYYNNPGNYGTPYQGPQVTDVVGNKQWVYGTSGYTDSNQQLANLNVYVHQLQEQAKARDKEIRGLKSENQKLLKENTKLSNVVKSSIKMIAAIVRSVSRQTGEVYKQIIVDDVFFEEVKEEDSIEIVKSKIMNQIIIKLK